MSWRFVFNTSLRWWSNMFEASVAARDCGYKFFNWNGLLYTVDCHQTEFREGECY